MSIETRMERARPRLRTEREHSTDRRRAYGRFEGELEAQSATTPGGECEPLADGGGLSMPSTIECVGTAVQCRRVRDVFTETVRPFDQRS